MGLISTRGLLRRLEYAMAKNNRGVVLILALLVTLVLSIVSVSFYTQNINENKLARRSVDSMRAFWLAEAGIAKSVTTNIPAAVNGFLSDSNHSYSVSVTPVSGTNYYTVNSTGTVNLPSGESVSRTITTTVEVQYLAATNFQHAIETTADQIIQRGANVHINPSDPNDPHGPKVDSDFSFSQLFGMSKEEMRAMADHLYTSSNLDTGNINNITWIDVNSGSTLNIAGNTSGTGILVINGNAKLTGTMQFSGIIYIIGKFTSTGTFDQYGSLLAESTPELDPELRGAATVNYDEAAIANAASNIVTGNTVVSWKE